MWLCLDCCLFFSQHQNRETAGMCEEEICSIIRYNARTHAVNVCVSVHCSVSAERKNAPPK